MTCQSITFPSHYCEHFRRVLCVFMVLYDRYSRFMYYDAFTGILSDFAEFRSILVIYGAKHTKMKSWLEIRASDQGASARSIESERSYSSSSQEAEGFPSARRNWSERSHKEKESCQLMIRALVVWRASARTESGWA